MGNKHHKRFKPSSVDEIKPPVSPSPPSSQPQPVAYLPDGVTLVWLDSHAEDLESEDEQSTMSMLRQLNTPLVRLFTNVSACLDFLNIVSSQEDLNTRHSRIFLIVSGSLSSQILPKLESLSIVDSVFIFCSVRSKYVHLINDYHPLVVDVCTEHDELSARLETQLKEFDLRTPVFYFFAQKQSTTRDLTQDAASFLWFQLFQSVLVQFKCDPTDKTIMLDYCSRQYARNRRQKEALLEIEEFRRTYKSDDAIRWYTKDSFVYRLINAALRTEDIEALCIFRFFIADLCRQLNVEHEKQSKHRKSPNLTLYRGAWMSKDEVNKLVDTAGGLTSLNGFISTSLQRWVATEFLNSKRSRQVNPQKVLFVIEVDTRMRHVVFADVSLSSEHSDEEEILFNIGTAFRLDQVRFDDKDEMWYVNMTATEAGVQAAQDYIDLIHRELTDTSEAVLFGELLIQMGKYVMSQKYFLDLLERCPSHPDLAAIHYNLGLICSFEKDLDEAEKHLLKAYECHKLIAFRQRDVVRTQNALGWIYEDNGELDQAMIHYKEALLIGERLLGSYHLANAQTHTNMASCHLEQQKFDQAKECYERALQIERIHLPVDHPRIGVTLNDLGDVSRKKKQMDDALNLYQEAEAIFRRNLPDHHPCTAYCWSCMGLVYLYRGDVEQAHEYHQRALKSYRRILPADHINIRISEKNAKCTKFQFTNDGYVRVCTQL